MFGRAIQSPQHPSESYPRNNRLKLPPPNSERAADRASLFDGDGLCQVARLIDVAAAPHREMVRQ